MLGLIVWLLLLIILMGIYREVGLFSTLAIGGLAAMGVNELMKN